MAKTPDLNTKNAPQHKLMAADKPTPQSKSGLTRKGSKGGK